jgi:hypothetical protein
MGGFRNNGTSAAENNFIIATESRPNRYVLLTNTERYRGEPALFMGCRGRQYAARSRAQ